MTEKLDFEKLLEQLRKAEDGIFSVFSNFDEQIKNEQSIILKNRDSLNFARAISKRVKKLVNKGETILFVRDYADFNKGKVAYLDIYFVLPKLWFDYLRGFQLWREDKTWNNFKAIFHKHLIFWVLNVSSKKDEERNVFDIFTIQVDDEYFEQSDIIRFTRMWLNKYFPGHNVQVMMLEEGDSK